MKYKKLVEQIKNLNWQAGTNRTLHSLMILSAYAATEFAESLRIALQDNPKSHAFKQMARGELKTTNLRFDGYSKRGDHANFLWHFIQTHLEPTAQLKEAGQNYLQAVQALPRSIRIESVVSRENELPGIFSAILENENMNSTRPLRAFQYYLQRHIELDSKEGGHADLLKKFEVTDDVAKFYKIRLEMYRVIPELFS